MTNPTNEKPLANTEFNQHLVHELQEERHQVWSLYCKVFEQKPFSSSAETTHLLTQFSQLLIDYVSLGHFGLYERLLSRAGREEVLKHAKTIYLEFFKITEVVMSFNDKYAIINAMKMDTLENDLSLLGEQLAKRIDLEDRLCHLVLN